MLKPRIYWIDLFCGAGGTSTGIHMADALATVIACVNHDANAILSHKENHPECLHLTEDVRDFNVVKKLKRLVDIIREKDPGCIINLWASLECTNFSKAKGGLPRDGDSRTLANALFMYIEALDLSYIYIENVREFMSWGPLDKYGKPTSRLNGTDYEKWCKGIKSYGYDYEYKLLNAADFGAYTSRNRYFGQFAKEDMPICWPTLTHSKKDEDDKESWKPVRDVLDLEDDGVSIFDRKKDLVENTLKRIYAGLIKFVAGGEDQFIKRYNGGNPWDKVKSMDHPLGTISTNGRHAKVKAVFLSTYYGNGGLTGTDVPCPTITTKDRVAKVSPQFFMNNYSSGGVVTSIDRPAPTVTAVPKSNLVSAEYSWLMDHQFSNKGKSINETAPTIIARQDKKPLYLMGCKGGSGFSIVVFEDDNETMIKIKEFMAMYGIMDIKMRMLKVDELLKIQGFPDDYQLIGTKTDQKKFIGNAVVPLVAQRLVEANYKGLLNSQVLTA